MNQFVEFAGNHPQLFVALGVVLAMLAFSYIRTATQGFSAVGPLEATQLINHEDALVLDIREAAELREGSILGSLHIPLGQLGTSMNQLERYREQPIIASCRSGSRSAVACSTLVKNGYTRVYNLRGGVLAWQNAGLPLSRD